MGLLTSLLNYESTDSFTEMIHKMFPSIVDDLVAQFLKREREIGNGGIVRRVPRQPREGEKGRLLARIVNFILYTREETISQRANINLPPARARVNANGYKQLCSCTLADPGAEQQQQLSHQQQYLTQRSARAHTASIRESVCERERQSSLALERGSRAERRYRRTQATLPSSHEAPADNDSPAATPTRAAQSIREKSKMKNRSIHVRGRVQRAASARQYKLSANEVKAHEAH
ncbi:unnamed protein product [Trichogramma brassicae]|uniref:Uncharacterized protein n=1 Tax=Trichogramma brassicae TaxID=86971 RepID=A0A6H5IB58_9HYME|nr:unnamed protein product [Trichogramma brassicae]